MRESPQARATDKPKVPGGLSAVLIAKDEELDLPGVLQSLRGLADEIVVLVDESSSDRTSELARQAGAKVSVRRFAGYADQKQAALELAGRAWILSLDCDERVSPELREEILATLSRGDPGVAGYEIPFAVHFMGRRLRFGGLGSESHLRLFQRAQARFVGGSLHEGAEVRGPIRRLRGRILHEPYRDLSEYLAKMNHYTTLAARKRYGQGRRFRPWQHGIPLWEFFSRAVLKLGVLDGIPGLVWAGLSAFHSWLKYAKLKEMEKEMEKRS